MMNSFIYKKNSEENYEEKFNAFAFLQNYLIEKYNAHLLNKLHFYCKSSFCTYRTIKIDFININDFQNYKSTKKPFKTTRHTCNKLLSNPSAHIYRLNIILNK